MSVRVVFVRYGGGEILGTRLLGTVPQKGDTVALGAPLGPSRDPYVTDREWVIPEDGEPFCRVWLRDPNRFVG